MGTGPFWGRATPLMPSEQTSSPGHSVGGRGSRQIQGDWRSNLGFAPRTLSVPRAAGITDGEPPKGKRGRGAEAPGTVRTRASINRVGGEPGVRTGPEVLRTPPPLLPSSRPRKQWAWPLPEVRRVGASGPTRPFPAHAPGRTPTTRGDASSGKWGSEQEPLLRAPPAHRARARGSRTGRKR